MENNVKKTRRDFLKKAAYIAPAVVALGALSAPTSGHAAVSVTFTVNGKTKTTIVDEKTPVGGAIAGWGN